MTTTGPPWEAAYETLYREHAGRVARLSRLLLRDPHEADEVTQEVFLKLVRAYPTEQRAIAWGPWLTRVTVNACRDRYRAGWWFRWRRSEPLEAVELADDRATPEGTALGREAHDRFWQVFRALPRGQREVLVLRHVEGWSTAEVAETLGVSTGTVKRQLFRAVQRLRSVLGEE